MKIEIDDRDVECRTTVQPDEDCIAIFQWELHQEEKDLVVLFSEDAARDVIEAIRKSAEKLGWKVE